jgi:uncharacterized protein YwgA
MTTSKEMVLIGGVVKALRERGSWTGETHVQKASFVAKQLRHIPFASEFVLYKHGPFSFELSQSLVHMRARSVLKTIPNPGYGPTFELNESLWKTLRSATGNFFSDYEDGIGEICDALATKNVAELERVATAVFLDAEMPGRPVEQRAEELVRIKPHITPELARIAFDEAAQLH